MSSTWDDYRAELEKLAQDNLRVAKDGSFWAVISLTKFWEETSDTPEVMDTGFTSERAAQLRLEAYVQNFSDIDSRINRACPAPHDRGSYVHPEEFNRCADKKLERERQLSVLKDAGVEDPDAVLDAILPKRKALPDDLEGEIPF